MFFVSFSFILMTKDPSGRESNAYALNEYLTYNPEHQCPHPHSFSPKDTNGKGVLLRAKVHEDKNDSLTNAAGSTKSDSEPTNSPTPHPYFPPLAPRFSAS